MRMKNNATSQIHERVHKNLVCEQTRYAGGLSNLFWYAGGMLVYSGMRMKFWYAVNMMVCGSTRLGMRSQVCGVNWSKRTEFSTLGVF